MNQFTDPILARTLRDRIRTNGYNFLRRDNTTDKFTKPGPIETILLTITIQGTQLKAERLYYHDYHYQSFDLTKPESLDEFTAFMQ